MLAVRAIAFDLDGTLYRGSETVPGAVDVVRSLHADHQIVYVTNSTVRSRATIAASLDRMGFPGGEALVYTSAASTAQYVRQNGFRAIHVVGKRSLTDELEAAGVPLCANAAVADALVIGLDDQWRLHHPELERLSETATVIACNLDDTYPVEGGLRRQGCGAVVGEIEDLLGRRHDVVVGKPGTYMLDLLLGDLDLSPHEIVVVGDSEASDIAAAASAGCHSVLIASDGASRSLADCVIASLVELPGCIG